MTAIASDFGYVFFARRGALRRAVFIVFADRANARRMSAFISFFCHR